MADGFVDLQAKLGAAEDEGANFFGALRGSVESYGFFGDERSVFQQVERFDEFVALESMLAAKTIGIRTLLNFFTLKRSGGNAAAGDYFTLVDARADAGGKPGIDFAELHVGFGERYAFDAAHFSVGREEQRELCFEGNFKGVFAEGALPTVNVGLFGSKNNFAAFGKRGGFGDGNGLRRARRDAFTRQSIRGGEAPGAICQDPNAEADRFALGKRANLAVLCGEVALAQMHHADVSVGGAAQARGIKSVDAKVPH